jgi:hypothetical protein
MPLPCIPQRGFRCLARVAAAPVFGQESKSDVDVGQRVALDQPAHAERQRIAVTLDHEQPETMVCVQALGTFRNVAARIVEIVYPPVADEAQPGGLVDEAEDEGRICRVEPAQTQALRFDLDDGFGHGRIVPRSTSPA